MSQERYIEAFRYQRMNIPQLRVYTHDELQEMQDKCNEIIKMLPNDYETAVDIISLVADSMFEDKEDFILRFRAMKVHRKQ